MWGRLSSLGQGLKEFTSEVIRPTLQDEEEEDDEEEDQQQPNQTSTPISSPPLLAAGAPSPSFIAAAQQPPPEFLQSGDMIDKKYVEEQWAILNQQRQQEAIKYEHAIATLRKQIENQENQNLVITQEYQKVIKEKQIEIERLKGVLESQRNENEMAVAQLSQKFNVLMREQDHKLNTTIADYEHKIAELNNVILEKDSSRLKLEKQVSQLDEQLSAARENIEQLQKQLQSTVPITTTPTPASPQKQPAAAESVATSDVALASTSSSFSTLFDQIMNKVNALQSQVSTLESEQVSHMRQQLQQQAKQKLEQAVQSLHQSQAQQQQLQSEQLKAFMNKWNELVQTRKQIIEEQKKRCQELLEQQKNNKAQQKTKAPVKEEQHAEAVITPEIPIVQQPVEVSEAEPAAETAEITAPIATAEGEAEQQPIEATEAPAVQQQQEAATSEPAPVVDPSEQQQQHTEDSTELIANPELNGASSEQQQQHPVELQVAEGDGQDVNDDIQPTVDVAEQLVEQHIQSVNDLVEQVNQFFQGFEASLAPIDNSTPTATDQEPTQTSIAASVQPVIEELTVLFNELKQSLAVELQSKSAKHNDQLQQLRNELSTVNKGKAEEAQEWKVLLAELNTFVDSLQGVPTPSTKKSTTSAKDQIQDIKTKLKNMQEGSQQKINTLQSEMARISKNSKDIEKKLTGLQSSILNLLTQYGILPPNSTAELGQLVELVENEFKAKQFFMNTCQYVKESIGNFFSNKANQKQNYVVDNDVATALYNVFSKAIQLANENSKIVEKLKQLQIQQVTLMNEYTETDRLKQQEIERLKSDLQQAAIALETNAQKYQRNLQELEDEISSRDVQIERLNNDLHVMQDNIHNVQLKYEDKLRQSQLVISQLQSEKQNAESIALSMNQKYSQHQEGAQVALLNLQTELEQLRQKEKNDKKQIESKIREVEKLQLELKEKNSELEQQEIAMNNLETVLEQFQTDYDKDIQKLSQILNATKLEMNIAKEESAKHLERLQLFEQLELQNREMQTEIQHKQVQFTMMKNQIDCMRKSLEDVVGRLNDENYIDRRIVNRVLFPESESGAGSASTSLSSARAFKVLVSALRLNEKQQERLKTAVTKVSSSGILNSSKSVSELWVAFLLQESGGANVTK